MLKQLAVGVLVGGLAIQAYGDEASLKKTIEAVYPRIKVQNVTKTPFNGLYEVFVDGQIFYTDEKFSYLIADGKLIDTQSKRNLTAERMEMLTRVDFSSLPLKSAIKVVKGNGSRKLVVFSDPDCPYCKRLEQKELASITDVTIYTFMYPLTELHPDAANKSKAIWCAPDRNRAWQDWIVKGQLVKNSPNCDTPLEAIAALGRQLGISSTPTLVFENGKRMMGAYPAQDIEKELAASKSQ